VARRVFAILEKVKLFPQMLRIYFAYGRGAYFAADEKAGGYRL